MNKSTAPLAGILIAAVLGIALGWFGHLTLGSGGSTRSTRSGLAKEGTTATLADATPGPSAEDTGSLVSSSGSRQFTGGAVEANSIEPLMPRAAIEAAVKEIQAVPMGTERGGRSITGFVVDPEGLPISGALVIATSSRPKLPRAMDPTRRGRAPSDDEYRESIDRIVESKVRARADRHTARTNAEGRFTIANLPDRKLTLNAYFDGFIFDSERNLYPPFKEVELMAQPLIQLPVKVTDADGNVPTHAYVRVTEGEHNESLYQWSPEKAFVPLKEGSYKLVARLHELGGEDEERTLKAESEEEQVLLLATDGPPEEVTLVVNPPNYLVVLVDGSEAARASGRVKVRKPGATETESRDPFMRHFRGRSNSARDVTKSAKATFNDVDLGALEVVFTPNQGAELEEIVERVEIVPGRNEHKLVLPEVKESPYLTMHVLGPGARPVPGCSFSIRHKSDSGTHTSGLNRPKFEGGAYQLEIHKLFERAGSGNPVSTLTVTSKRYGKVELDIKDSDREQTVNFERPLEVTIQLIGVGVDKWRVSLNAKKGEDTWNGSNVEDGIATFQNIQPGSYFATATTGQGMWGEGPGRVELPVEVRKGKTHIKVDVPTLHDLVIVSEKNHGFNLIELDPVDGSRNWFHNDRDGNKTTFFSLSPGPYLVTSGGLYMEVSVPSGEVQFLGSRSRGLRVMSVNDNSPADNAGLRIGDVITGLNGVPFKEGVRRVRGAKQGDMMSLQSGRSVAYPGSMSGVRLQPVP